MNIEKLRKRENTKQDADVSKHARNDSERNRFISGYGVVYLPNVLEKQKCGIRGGH